MSRHLVTEFPSEGEEDDGLQESLLYLSRLSTNGLGLEQLLTRVAGYAVQAIPGAKGPGDAGVENRRVALVVDHAAIADDQVTALGE